MFMNFHYSCSVNVPSLNRLNYFLHYDDPLGYMKELAGLSSIY